ncbi:MAG: hypothetical protein ACRD2N_22745, partial [Vicinamibacterales bacterium]
ADDTGHVVRYGYDAAGRLVSTASGDSVVEYSYNYRDLASINVSGRPILRIEYDDNRRVSHLALADGRHYRFDFVISARDSVVRRVVVHRPDGTQETVTIDP